MNAKNLAAAVAFAAGLAGCSGAEIGNQSEPKKIPAPIECPERTHRAEGLLNPHNPESTATGCLNDRWKTVDDLRGICRTIVLQVTRNGSWRCEDFPRK